MTLTKRFVWRKRMRPTVRICEALVALGFDRSEVLHDHNRHSTHPGKPRPNLHFFDRHPEGELYDWLEKAKAKYRQRMKDAHPDRTGSHDKAVEINLAWERVKLLFARDGIILT